MCVHCSGWDRICWHCSHHSGVHLIRPHSLCVHRTHSVSWRTSHRYTWTPAARGREVESDLQLLRHMQTHSQSLRQPAQILLFCSCWEFNTSIFITKHNISLTTMCMHFIVSLYLVFPLCWPEVLSWRGLHKFVQHRMSFRSSFVVQDTTKDNKNYTIDKGKTQKPWQAVSLHYFSFQLCKTHPNYCRKSTGWGMWDSINEQNNPFLCSFAHFTCLPSCVFLIIESPKWITKTKFQAYQIQVPLSEGILSRIIHKLLALQSFLSEIRITFGLTGLTELHWHRMTHVFYFLHLHNSS